MPSLCLSYAELVGISNGKVAFPIIRRFRIKMRVIKPTPAIRTLIPEIALATGRSVDWIYERQRDLVTAGALVALPGRGPGSGVPASPENLAVLLMALAIWDRGVPSSELRKLAGAKATAAYSVIGIGARLDAVLAEIMRLRDHADRAGLPVRPVEIHIFRDTLSASVFWPLGGVQHYVQAKPKSEVGLRSVSILTGALFGKIDQILRTAI